MLWLLSRPAPVTLAERLASILSDVAQAIAWHRPPDPARLPFLAAAGAWIRRKANRLAALMARFQAGTLPPPRTPQPPPAAAAPAAAPDPELPPGPPPDPPPLRLPQGKAWLIRRVPHTPVFGSQLQAWLTDPELPAFLAAAPQAGRLLRPLCRALGIPIPEILRLPPRPPDPERDAAREAARAEARAARLATRLAAREAARAEAAWGRALRRSLGFPARPSRDAWAVQPRARPPPKPS